MTSVSAKRSYGPCWPKLERKGYPSANQVGVKRHRQAAPKFTSNGIPPACSADQWNMRFIHAQTRCI